MKSYEVVLKSTIYYYKVIMIEAIDQRRIDGPGAWITGAGAVR